MLHHFGIHFVGDKALLGWGCPKQSSCAWSACYNGLSQFSLLPLISFWAYLAVVRTTWMTSCLLYYGKNIKLLVCVLYLTSNVLWALYFVCIYAHALTLCQLRFMFNFFVPQTSCSGSTVVRPPHRLCKTEIFGMNPIHLMYLCGCLKYIIYYCLLILFRICWESFVQQLIDARY